MIPALLNKMFLGATAAAGFGWDAATAHNVALSNGDLTATNTFGPGPFGVTAALAGAKTTGKFYFEVTATLQNSIDSLGFGICATTATYSGLGSSGTGGVVCYESGSIFSNGSSGGLIGGGGPGLTGDVTGIAVDLTNRTIWFKVVAGPDQFSNWNNSGTANPATNTGGVSVLAGSIVPFLLFEASGGAANGGVQTINLGGAAFSGTAPAGFSAWGAATTLDPSTVSLPISLSNGNLTATDAYSSDQGVKVATSSGKTSGKYYFEITCVTLPLWVLTPYEMDFGICLPVATYIALHTDGTGGVAAYDNGLVKSEGSQLGQCFNGFSDGDTMAIAVDLDNRSIWFKNVAGPDAPSDWNNDPGNDPATNTGGLTIPAGTMVPFCNFASIAAGNVFTANFGATAFSGTVPSGFTSGWPE